MPDYRRSRDPGATYFFTVVTQNRLPIFNEPEARRLLRDALTKTVLETLEIYAPGLGALVEKAETLTPADIEARTKIPGGHWHRRPGWSH